MYAFCSCLKFGHVTMNDDVTILPKRWVKKDGLFTCGKNACFGVGMIDARIIDDYLLLLPHHADVGRLADLLYCALTGWTDFTISILWYATPPNPIIQEPSGIALKTQVPFLTNEKWDEEKWMANNYEVKIEANPEHARMLKKDLQALAAKLATTVGASTEETKIALERMAFGLNSLSAQAAHFFWQDPTMPNLAGQQVIEGIKEGLVWSDEVPEDIDIPESPIRFVKQYTVEKALIPKDREVEQLSYTLGEVASRLGLSAEQAIAALHDRRVPDTITAIDENTLLQTDPEAMALYNQVTGGSMGKDSKIGWTTHTFNPWWGCYKVGPGCANCYAQTMAHRWRFNIWGQYTDRRLMSDSTWAKPFKWHEQANGAEDKITVFCGSMCDVFEQHANPEWAATLDTQRKRLWDMISATTDLTWLILTKRTSAIAGLMPTTLGEHIMADNVWLGGSVSNQAEMRDICEPLDKLRETRGIPYFLSVEPMLSKVRLGPFNPNWVIIGGESGHNARPFNANHALDLMYQDCEPRGIPVFMKQLGSHVARSARLKSALGSDPEEWRDDLRVQQFPWDKHQHVWPTRMFVGDQIEQIAEEWDSVEI